MKRHLKQIAPDYYQCFFRFHRPRCRINFGFVLFLFLAGRFHLCLSTLLRGTSSNIHPLQIGRSYSRLHQPTLKVAVIAGSCAVCCVIKNFPVNKHATYTTTCAAFRLGLLFQFIWLCKSRRGSVVMGGSEFVCISNDARCVYL